VNLANPPLRSAATHAPQRLAVTHPPEWAELVPQQESDRVYSKLILCIS
jgi:hypothetical protein